MVYIVKEVTDKFRDVLTSDNVAYYNRCGNCMHLNLHLIDPIGEITDISLPCKLKRVIIPQVDLRVVNRWPRQLVKSCQHCSDRKIKTDNKPIQASSFIRSLLDDKRSVDDIIDVFKFNIANSILIHNTRPNAVNQLYITANWSIGKVDNTIDVKTPYVQFADKTPTNFDEKAFYIALKPDVYLSCTEIADRVIGMLKTDHVQFQYLTDPLSIEINQIASSINEYNLIVKPQVDSAFDMVSILDSMSPGCYHVTKENNQPAKIVLIKFPTGEFTLIDIQADPNHMFQRDLTAKTVVSTLKLRFKGVYGIKSLY